MIANQRWRPSARSYRTSYSDCAQGVRVEHYRLERGTHDWPETLLGQPTSETMWSFLHQYTLAGKKVQRH